MVKADLTRDYYGDLELLPGADIQEIKKQFKKLALTYHPDRNPGRETEVTAKFQKIQSAHEVLIDATERARYDANRVRVTSSHYKSAYGGPTSSGVRGNPWSSAGSQWAPPPKPPTARRAPPPSTGARRYEKFDTPKNSSHWSSQEGPEARARTYEAWEHMRSHNSAKPSPGRTGGPPKPPPRETPQPARGDGEARRYGAASKPRAAYDDTRNGHMPNETPRRRSQSTNTSPRKGFMPNTPGGDEPAAPRGAYFTTQRAPPDPPPRKPSPSVSNVAPDPLKQFRDKASNFEPRVSTPYATHGGEKFNPFETANISRSKSTREPSSSKHVPRTGSDPNLASPRRTTTFADQYPSKPSNSYAAPQVEVDSSSSEDEPRTNGHAFGKPRYSTKASNGTSAPPRAPQVPNAGKASSNPRAATTNIGKFRQWMRENPGVEPPLNGFPPDGPPLRSDPPKNDTPDGTKMYATFTHSSIYSDRKRSSSYSVKVPTVSEDMSSQNPKIASNSTPKYLFSKGTEPKTPPSGVTPDSQTLNAFEGLQRTVIDQLLSSKGKNSCSNPHHNATPLKRASENNGQTSRSSNCRIPSRASHWLDYRDSANAGSPSKKLKPLKHLHAVHLHSAKKANGFWQDYGELKANANQSGYSRFSFNVDNDTFKQTNPPPRTFASSSTENISTTFSPEDWTGTFEAGAEYFKPNQKTTGVSSGPHRGQSGSRSRGRSPTKVPPVDPKFPQPSAVPETPIESPGGTKFSPDQWAQIFKPQTFAPPNIPPRPNRPRPTPTRPAMATPPVAGGSGVGADKAGFGTNPATPSAPTTPNPDAMDVDTPPVTNTVPQFANKLNINTESVKRPAPTSHSQSPTDAEALKVNFDDLNIQDLISSLNLPLPPSGPVVPQPPSRPNSPLGPAYETFKKKFEIYMGEWDLFNSKNMLHLVARKNQVDTLGAERWQDNAGIELYRRGLREDAVVIKHWQDAREAHEKVMKEYVVVRERMKSQSEMKKAGVAAGEDQRPRKKTH
ncbi:uncharacterized protein BP5553_06386 [Venustampulla echinocandica]|uniref:J domain-containing protein n=1 Tax=Venustampulla echinocandica TaxID=2656787 RepID=A0A370TJT1_9HELO|nr:uncharacterized protein BP5553_06386 [Venustampulla echinocandica]RDL35774.1 hypothetical protein BP5553_06386 [Venustampulla echinocandica]